MEKLIRRFSSVKNGKNSEISKISYADTYNRKVGDLLIRAVEKLFCRKKISYRYEIFCTLLDAGVEVSEAVSTALGIKPHVTFGSTASIPSKGGTLIVANHPYGIVDGLAIANLVRKRRADVLVLAHEGVSRLPQFKDYFLPIVFENSPKAKKINKASLVKFSKHLKSGGLGIIFPSAAVSTKKNIWGRNEDPPWNNGAAKMAKQYDVTVVPMFVEGGCGFWFQLASQVSLTLRLSTLLRENIKKIDSGIHVRIGLPLRVRDLPVSWSIDDITDYFRYLTYQLDPGSKQEKS